MNNASFPSRPSDAFASDAAPLRSLLAAARDLTARLEAAIAQPPAPAAPAVSAPAVAADRPRVDDARLILPTDWPRVGGRDYQPHSREVFSSPEFQAAWKPGRCQRAIYVAACTGLSDLAQKIRIPIFKVSTCGVDRVWQRRCELRRDAYGAVYHAGGCYAVDGGWNNWFPSLLTMRRLPSPHSPVRSGERSLIVNLPDGMSAEDFDRAFDFEIRKGAIDLWSMTDEGRNHCATLGLDPAILRRFTEYPGGSDVRRSPVKELVAINPLLAGSGADRIAAIAETVILNHLGIETDYGQLAV